MPRSSANDHMRQAGSRILQGASSTLRTVATTAGRETRVPLGANRRYRRLVRYRILGPVEASGRNGPAPIGGPKQRTVLAHLILSPGRVVAADQLIEAVWGETPPEAARGILQTYVSRLRSILGPDAIESRPPGYVLRADPEDVDAVRFERLLREARRGAVDPKDAVRTLSEALDLWRGPALADLADEAFVARSRSRASRSCVSRPSEERIAAELELGLQAQSIAELESLTRMHPLRERLWEELILALYRVGRPADALAAYERAREHPGRRAWDRPLARSPGVARADPPRGLRARTAGRTSPRLPDPRAGWRGRLRGGLSRAPTADRPRGRDQGDAARAREPPGFRAALRARGADRRQARAPAHRAAIRLLARARRRLPGDALPPRRQP